MANNSASQKQPQIFPLSHGQQAMWFLYQIAPQSVAYNIFMTVRLCGELDLGAWHRAWQKIVESHSILRTTYTEREGQPFQVVHPYQEVDIQVIDASLGSEDYLKKQILAETDRPFNLESDRVLRVRLFTRSPQEHIQLLSMHHIAGDMWSFDILLNEFQIFYAAAQNSVSDRILPLPRLSYIDYIHWQSEILASSRGEQLSTYWHKQLAGELPLLDLPLDKPRSRVQTYNGAYHLIELDRELHQKLRQLADSEKTSLYRILLSAFFVLLHRLSGQADIVIGSPMAGRSGREEFSEIVGYFTDPVVLRGNLAENPTFKEFLAQVRSTVSEAKKHQDYPFSWLVKQLVSERDPSRPPLFQVAFTWQKHNWYKQTQNRSLEPEKTLLLMEPYLIAGHQRGAAFDINLAVVEAGDSLQLCWQYNTDLFDAAAIARMAENYQILLEGILFNPEQQVSELPLLTPKERHQLLFEWNNTEFKHPQDKCIHQLFEEQVRRTPDAIAVEFGTEQLTYNELNQRANKLARYLQTLGVEPEVLVGIYVERSLFMLISILSILKAGGAYVPLDPAYPAERLTYILNDSQVSVLLTQQKLTAQIFDQNLQVLCLDTDWEIVSQFNQENLVSNVQPENLAYIIYTSGSTGNPKGVLINHYNVVRLFAATEAWFNFNERDVWTLFHSYAFDFSVWEIWGALISGGKLVIVPYLVSREPEAFYELLCQKQVTILNQTPSAFRQLIKAEESTKVAGNLQLRLVIFGGESLELESLKPWFERHGDTSPQLVNMYGITETTVHVTYRPLKITDLDTNASVIGRPIPDLQLYVLDKYQQLVPIGVKGEMYIGGASLARGYLNRPELTKERFISYSPLSSKLYKTGDLARYLPNGELEYLGRIDNQVKIRGFRIELGEIENAIASHPDVQESVVVVRDDEPGDKRLVAYVVSNLEQHLKAGELRRFLKQKLPEYMIPAAFVQLEALPLTANGKVDRRVLPKPDTARPELEAAYQAPNTPEEKLLVDIWTQILGWEQVGIHDNFFALGGDSIRSIQVQSLAQKHGLSFSVAQVFQYQTIHELVQELKIADNFTIKLELSQPFSLISPADKQHLPDGVEDAYPLTRLQMGMLFHSEYRRESAVYHDIFSFYLQAPLDVQALQFAVQDLVNHHAVLRTSFELSSFSLPLQLVHQKVEIPLQVEDWCHLQNSEQEEALAAWFESEKKSHFEWTHPPLVRFFVHRRTQETFNLTVSFHHAILDGWSVASLVTELLRRYLAILSEQVDFSFRPLSSVFRDFVVLEQQAIASANSQQYWSQKLKDSTITKLPRWSVSPTQAVGQQFCFQAVPLSSEISEGLKQLAKSVGVPLKSVLLTAHLRVLNLLSANADVLTGLVTNGRPEQTDGERILGLFLNTLPFRQELSGGTWIDLVKAVFATEQELLPHRRYPLVEIQKSLGGQALFETTFNFTHFHVYEQLQELKNLQLLGRKFFEETNFTFNAGFNLNPDSSQIELSLGYDACELCPGQINKISDYYANTLAAMANEPTGRYELHPLLSVEEQNQLLVQWNNTQTDFPKEFCIHQLFEAQVEQTPDAIAVVFENEHLTYTQLNAKANQLAHHLQTLGVKPEVMVGICVERSLFMLIGILGILKAGGAYVPLDPAYPSERLAYILSDSQVQVLLTQENLLAALPNHTAELLCLDTDWVIISTQGEENPHIEVQASNLAYVIYTSGSTGQPKGVMIEHRSLVNFTQAFTDKSKINKRNAYGRHCLRVLQFLSISFDGAAAEIYPCLLCGGTLVIATSEVFTSVSKFLQKSEEWQISVWILPTAYWHQLTSELAWTQKLIPPSIRLITIGGEAAQEQTLRLWQKSVDEKIRSHQLGEPPLLINCYGPSEATVVATTLKLSDFLNVSDRQTLLPIGKPIANIKTYILDRYQQPVPIGVLGELYIGGECLARGYLNRPDLTAEKFINWTFQKSQRLYKTGDLARYLPDGKIEFRGRIDRQVKIRGFRIELAEVEAAIASFAGVRENVVVAREDQPSNKSLVAYVVANQQPFPSSELRRYLQQKLPEYMLPSAFVVLEALPLTSNGKVDFRALPEPEFHPELQQNFVAPRTPIEEMLASIWAEVLVIPQVGIYDNFFELGGHSLLATQAISRLQTTLDIEFPLRSLFEAPTIAELGDRIQIAISNGQSVQTPPLLPIPRSAQIPLSFAQRRIWFLKQLESDSASYNSPVALRFSGKLNITALESSLNAIISRHEALRTNFVTVDGQPVQVIAPTLNLKLPLVDLQHLPIQEREVETQRLAKTEALQPFDLERESLVRVKLLRLDKDEYVLLLTLHHIVFDGWSFGVLYGELAKLYLGFCTNDIPGLPELLIQYADFAVWQRRWLTREALQTQFDYWKQQLKDAPTLLELPTDRPRTAIQTFQGAHQYVTLPPNLSQALANLSRREGVTLFMTLYAAFVTLLYRYTGSDDILVGTPIANRNHPEIEGLIGFFVNTLVLRTQFQGNPSFQDVLSGVREMALQGYAHQDLPFEELVEVLQPARSLSHSPLFQVMFVFQNTPMPAMDLPELRVSSLAVETGTTNFDLTLSMENTASGLIAEWEYNSDLFDDSTIARIAGQFQVLLEGIVNSPSSRISDLPLLRESEQQQLLEEWNSTFAEYPQHKCIHQLFEAQVEQTPDAIAVVFENEHLTYAQLNAKANQLAHHLQTLGVKPEVMVGICVERSLFMLIGILGILKAGGAYVPLDPAYPSERLAYILSDSQVQVLLTQENLLATLPNDAAELLCLDTDWVIISNQGKENPHIEVQASNLAYVIYTSGSTGQPKGVMIEHRSLVNFTHAARYDYGIGKRDCVLQFASISFDAAAAEIYPCLTCGGKLVLSTSEIYTSIAKFLQKSEEWQISVWILPTAYWHQLTSELSFTQELIPPSIRLVFIGGEAAQEQTLRLWQKSVDERIRSQRQEEPPLLFNVYGPSETTVDATAFKFLQLQPSDRHFILPIGRPISNVKAYILDRYQQPVPIGVLGELYIGGECLARGYLNRPDLTAEKFIDWTFQKSQRLYKTGDLARYLPDGKIEFRGRIDRQVKIRGFRIELGEIETVLTTHPQVEDAVVIDSEDVPGSKRLIAYVVAYEQSSFKNQLRDYLKQKLPDYMIPSAFVILESLPLTPNGKVDRQALLAYQVNNDANNFVLPRTYTEKVLAKIWQDVLNLEQVSVLQNFFELGGDSIISIQIIARAHQAGLQITTKQLFQHQTIAELAIATVNTTTSIVAEQGLVTGIVPLTPIQHGFFEENWTEPHHFNQSMLLEVPPDLKPALLEQVVRELIIHHDALRMRFVRDELGWQQQNSDDCQQVPFQLIDLSSLAEEEHKAAIEQQANQLQTTLNLEEGPLLRAVLFKLGNDRPGRLLLIVHHLVVDGVSWRILLEDLATAYQQLQQTQTIQLPPKTTSFQDWAIRLQDYGRSHSCKQELDYWLAQCDRHIRPIPVDYPTGLGLAANTVGSTEETTVFLSAAETTALLEKVPSVYNTQINDVLLTALVQTFAQWTGNCALLVELEGHGREELFEDVYLSRTVGWFTSIYPVRLELSTAFDLGVALKSIKEQLRRIPNRGIGYGILRYLSQNAEIQKKLQEIARSQICFNYLGQLDQVLSSNIWQKFAQENTGQGLSPLAKRSYLLDVVGSVVAGKLQMTWFYNRNVHRRATIEGLANEYNSVLRSLIAHCQSSEGGGYTPTDFPLVDLSQEDLDDLLSKIDLS
ncbi:MAG: amino acid adenylation domain-containing protein [Nostoc sp.]|uniref:non-ribosomal peptide synthetase n=1 Tax=Nostoc sp. TaxID=1180 RepID=UPI002FFCABA8